MKEYTDFLLALTDAERDFIANLDYSEDVDEHRRQLDLVIAKGGIVDLPTQYWYPYEVIELGKNYMTEGHEREFVACNSIVLYNISTGNDECNDVYEVYPHFLSFKSRIDADHLMMVEKLARLAKPQCRHSTLSDDWFYNNW